MAASYPFLSPFVEVKKRKAFFSFHYDDIMRVNNVRNAWKIDHPDTPARRSFYDSSLWESRKLEGPEALKRLIREGAQNTSAICVLIGSETWSREWVRYEIARAIIDNRGLLGVYINGLKHHTMGFPHPNGPNPFEYIGIYREDNAYLGTTQYYLCESEGHGWNRYLHYSQPVSLPAYMTPPAPGYVRQLSSAVPTYDFVAQEGHRNIGAWIDAAAQRVGR
ncbi:MAG: TIR domain-containing protein [Proteobacteria bacterium]|nr:TIR domain-containing protein [Pseudomonadota bacterium]